MTSVKLWSARARWTNDDHSLTVEAQRAMDTLQRRTGGVTGVVEAVDISFTPFGTLASTNVQTALQELDTEKVATTRTINGYPLSSNITLTYSDVGADPTGAASGAIATHLAASDPHPQYALDTDLAGYVPVTRTVNGHALSANVTVTAADVGAPSGSGTSSGTNTGDQTITLTGGVTGSGTGSFAATVVTNANLTGNVTSVGNATTIAAGVVTLAMQANMATASVVYRKTAGAGAPEVQTLATLKTDLGLTGTNSGDQTITLTGDATGSGTGSFAVNVGKINGVAFSGLATGILKNTTTTGVPSIAVAADFPTLNQNTTGSAATLTTARTIDGQSFDGSANITVIAPGTHAATSKATPVDADELPLVDSAASNVLKKLTWANLKATLNAVYQPLAATLTSWAAITRASGFDTFTATPTSANLKALLTDEIGPSSGLSVFGLAATTFTATATGMTTSPTATWSYCVSGGMCQLTIVAISGTSNATTFTVTGIPAGATPSASRTMMVRGVDNGVGNVLLAVIDSSGVMTLTYSFANSAFTNSGTKSISAGSVCYLL